MSSINFLTSFNTCSLEEAKIKKNYDFCPYFLMPFFPFKEPDDPRLKVNKGTFILKRCLSWQWLEETLLMYLSEWKEWVFKYQRVQRRSCVFDTRCSNGQEFHSTRAGYPLRVCVGSVPLVQHNKLSTLYHYASLSVYLCCSIKLLIMAHKYAYGTKYARGMEHRELISIKIITIQISPPPPPPPHH